MPLERERQPSAWNVANALTVLRLLLVPLLAWLLLRDGGEDDPSRVAAFVTFSVALVTDRVDGELARRRGLVT
ncbi:MAG TPA: CDP-alcohol phosphatidyltransferase family protein, partial [Jiangellaceae bacterium]|nr:CDP-alcohol phosphatidyltransferase family protein [Jiangellaceae bacterium]